MGDIVRLTSQPILLTGPTLQPLYLAVDVLEYDQIEIACTLISYEGNSPEAIIALTTGMQTNSDDGWYAAATFANLTATTRVSRLTLAGNYQRYLRWLVAGIAPSTAISFYIEGVGRRL